MILAYAQMFDIKGVKEREVDDNFDPMVEIKEASRMDVVRVVKDKLIN